MSALSKNILTTLVYYDILDYPMTSFEIWKYLLSCNIEHETCSEDREGNEQIKLADVIKELSSDGLKNKVEQYRGYYFLKGRKNLVEQRIERNKIAEKKFKKVRKIVRILKFVPFVRMIAVTGRLAMKNTDRSSDLDLLIVLKHGHIFIGRTLVTLMTHMLGIRRYGRKIADRICLNFFITDKTLAIPIKDLFSSSEYYFIWPLFGYETFRDFQEANAWIENFRENYILENTASAKLVEDSSFSKTVRKAGELIFSAKSLENWLKGWQTRRIQNDPRTHQSGSMVMADDNALIFLPEPQGPGVFEKFQEKIAALDAGK